jgi:hypothetical protein
MSAIDKAQHEPPQGLDGLESTPEQLESPSPSAARSAEAAVPPGRTVETTSAPRRIGAMEGSGRRLGNVVAPTTADDEWDALRN